MQLTPTRPSTKGAPVRQMAKPWPFLVLSQFRLQDEVLVGARRVVATTRAQWSLKIPPAIER